MTTDFFSYILNINLNIIRSINFVTLVSITCVRIIFILIKMFYLNWNYYLLQARPYLLHVESTSQSYLKYKLFRGG